MEIGRKSPLGKAEWIKFFGALYGLDSKANSVFSEIEYNATLVLAKATQPTVLSGRCSKINGTYHKASWAALFLKDAQADYLWRDTRVLEVHPCLLRLF
jgi:iron complex transport system substrate-binding protein